MKATVHFKLIGRIKNISRMNIYVFIYVNIYVNIVFHINSFVRKMRKI